MNVISKRALDKFIQRHPESASPLNAWYQVVKRASWRHFADLRPTYASADQVDRFVVFNVGGNRYRLIADIHYAREDASGTVFLRHALTHDEYSRGRWKSG